MAGSLVPPSQDARVVILSVAVPASQRDDIARNLSRALDAAIRNLFANLHLGACLQAERSTFIVPSPAADALEESQTWGLQKLQLAARTVAATAA